jgi:hypothetical protein
VQLSEAEGGVQNIIALQFPSLFTDDMSDGQLLKIGFSRSLTVTVKLQIVEFPESSEEE